MSFNDYRSQNQEKFVTLKDTKGKPRGVYVPKKDYEENKRCLSCGILLSHKARPTNLIKYCTFCT